MSASFCDNPEELRGQVRGHVQSLRAAGVEWLPAGTRVELKFAAAETEVEPVGIAPAPPPALETPHAAPPADLDQRRQALQVLAAEVKSCMCCAELASTRTQTVFGVGPPGVELCFVGEAPGADEDAQGMPFVGRAGDLLNRIIAACGFKREEVYICNTIKCRPPGNRTPLPLELRNCREYFDRQLELVRPT